eukprot:3813023-Pleurochrysis_carterae.AAC.1
MAVYADACVRMRVRPLARTRGCTLWQIRTQMDKRYPTDSHNSQHERTFLRQQHSSPRIPHELGTRAGKREPDSRWSIGETQGCERRIKIKRQKVEWKDCSALRVQQLLISSRIACRGSIDKRTAPPVTSRKRTTPDTAVR